MKHLIKTQNFFKNKISEDIKISKNEPQIDDFVICDMGDVSHQIINDYRDSLNDYLKTLIGKIIRLHVNNFALIKYEDLPEKYSSGLSFMSNQRWISKQRIKYWSKNKEDLEIILTQQKYNL
jgi:hypothetical protein